MDPFVSFSFFNVSPLPHMLLSLFFFSPPTSQICHLFRFSCCLSIPPKPNPNPNSVNQSQDCILTPNSPLRDLRSIASNRMSVRFLNLILNLPFRKRLPWSC